MASRGSQCQRQLCFPRGGGVSRKHWRQGSLQQLFRSPSRNLVASPCLSHGGMHEPEDPLLRHFKEMRPQPRFQSDSAAFPEPHQRLGRAEEKLQQSCVLR